MADENKPFQSSTFNEKFGGDTKTAPAGNMPPPRPPVTTATPTPAKPIPPKSVAPAPKTTLVPPRPNTASPVPRDVPREAYTHQKHHGPVIKGNSE